MHRHESPATLPARIALGMVRVLRCYHDIAKGRLRPRCDYAANLLRAGGRRCPNQKSTVLADRRHDVAARGGEYEQVWRDLRYTNNRLLGQCEVRQQHGGTYHEVEAMLNTTWLEGHVFLLTRNSNQRQA